MEIANQSAQTNQYIRVWVIECVSRVEDLQPPGTPLPKINNIPILLCNKFQESIQDHAYELVARHTRDTGLFAVKTILHSYSMELVTFQSQMGNKQRSTILCTTVTSNLHKILRIGWLMRKLQNMNKLEWLFYNRRFTPHGVPRKKFDAKVSVNFPHFPIWKKSVRLTWDSNL